MSTHSGRDSIAVYVALALVALTVLLEWNGLDALLPDNVVVSIRRNNEAPIFMALAILTISLENPVKRELGWIWWSLVGAGFVVTNIFGRSIGLPQSVITLSEAFLGIAFLGAYLYTIGDRRDGRPRVWPYVAAAALVLLGEFPVGGFDESAVGEWLSGQAEAFGFFILTALYLDFVRPWPFSRRKVSAKRHVVWFGALVVIPLLVRLFNDHGVDPIGAEGFVELALVWTQRIMEAFIAAIGLSIYYWWRLDRSGRSRD